VSPSSAAAAVVVGPGRVDGTGSAEDEGPADGARPTGGPGGVLAREEGVAVSLRGLMAADPAA
jgi:hypothetical protein